jgi:hypothetical protein
MAAVTLLLLMLAAVGLASKLDHPAGITDAAWFEDGTTSWAKNNSSGAISLRRGVVHRALPVELMVIAI